MSKVIIVEDDKNIALMLKKHFEEYINRKESKYFDLIELVIDNYESWMKNKLTKWNNQDLYVLDIDLEDSISGFHVAQEIRKYNSTCNILFVTSHIELMGQVFQHNIKAMTFIYKGDPLIKDRIFSAMDQIYHEFSLSSESIVTESYLTYQYKGNYYKISYNDIEVIETDPIKRRIEIQTTQENYPCQIKLKDLLEDLPENFLRVHRSIVVNSKVIKRIITTDGLYSVEMKNGKILPLSRSYSDEVINAFHDHSFV